MHLLRLLERWAAPEPHLERRQTTARTTALPATTNNPLPTIISSVASVITSAAKPDPTTEETQAPTTREPATTTQRTTDQPQTSNTPQTTPRTTQQQTTTPTTQPTTKGQTTQNKPTAVTTLVDPTGTDDSSPVTNTLDQFTGAAAATGKGRGSTGGFDGVKGKDIAVGVGVVVGVVGGFALLVIGIYMWRRHQRRRQMERIGSMEELPRPPSPGPLSRSFTRGHGPRQPIDDDDDDFLTPMDTLPNTHRMDEWDSSKSSPENTAQFDDKSVYAESIYGDDQEPSLPAAFPVAPPAAAVAANNRYYSGDFSGMRPKTPQLGSGNSSGSTIPTYSSMSKYTAFTPGAALTTPVGSAITTNTSTPTPPNHRLSMLRPGGGYRSYDSHDAGGYV